DIGRLGHEVNAAEDDELRVAAFRRPARKIEGVAAIVRELNDVLALVVMAEHHTARAEPPPGFGDALAQRSPVEPPVRLRDVLLPESEGALLGQRPSVERAVRGASVGLVQYGSLGHRQWRGR